MLRPFISQLTTFIFLIIFSINTAVAQQAGAVKQPGFAEVITKMMPLLVIVFFIFYFLVIRPQEKKLKAQQQMLENLKKGTQVVTSGGIIARVAGLEKDYILLEVSNNTRVKLEKSHIVKIYEPPSKNAGKQKSAA